MEYHKNRWFYTYRLMYIVYHIDKYIMEIFYNGISFMGDNGTSWDIVNGIQWNIMEHHGSTGLP